METASFFSLLLHNVQTYSGAHPASYPVGTGRFFPGGKRQRREADYCPATTNAEVEKTLIYASTLLYFFMA
jgi:hypothetical protein